MQLINDYHNTIFYKIESQSTLKQIIHIINILMKINI